MKSPSSLVPVIAGFGVMLLLLLAVTVIGVTHIRMLSDQLTAIVAERNQKSEYVVKLHGLNQSRYQSLRLAALIDDPFERDAELMRFSRMVLDFIRVRENFQAMPLDNDELTSWHAVRAEVRTAEDIAEAIVELVQAERLDEARVRLDNELTLAQERVAQGWERLLALQSEKNRVALADAGAARARAQSLVIALSASAFLVGVVIAVFVVRLSRRLEKDLFEEKELAQVTLHAIGDAVVRVDRDLRVAYLNPVAEHLLGMSAREVIGLPIDSALRLRERHGDEELAVTLAETIGAGQPCVLPDHAVLRARDGLEYEVEGQCSPVHAPDGEIDGGVLVMRDVSEAREMQRKLHWQANHDSLTGLINRHAFEERVSRALTGQRRGQFPMSLLFIDLDHFKQVNDSAGHAAGDELLRQLAVAMQSCIRESDILARLGGDEFGVLLLSCPDGMAEKIARDVREAVAGHLFVWEETTHRVGASIGVVHVPPLWNTLDACLAAADAACYKAKQGGRNDVVVHRH